MQLVLLVGQQRQPKDLLQPKLHEHQRQVLYRLQLMLQHCGLALLPLLLLNFEQHYVVVPLQRHFVVVDDDDVHEHWQLVAAVVVGLEQKHWRLLLWRVWDRECNCKEERF